MTSQYIVSHYVEKPAPLEMGFGDTLYPLGTHPDQRKSRHRHGDRKQRAPGVDAVCQVRQ